jgi:hypothetical protein
MLAMIPIFAVDDPNRTLRYGSPIAFGQGIHSKKSLQTVRWVSSSARVGATSHFLICIHSDMRARPVSSQILHFYVVHPRHDPPPPSADCKDSRLPFSLAHSTGTRRAIQPSAAPRLGSGPEVLGEKWEHLRLEPLLDAIAVIAFVCRISSWFQWTSERFSGIGPRQEESVPVHPGRGL